MHLLQVLDSEALQVALSSFHTRSEVIETVNTGDGTVYRAAKVRAQLRGALPDVSPRTDPRTTCTCFPCARRDAFHWPSIYASARNPSIFSSKRKSSWSKGFRQTGEIGGCELRKGQANFSIRVRLPSGSTFAKRGVGLLRYSGVANSRSCPRSFGVRLPALTER